MGGECAWEAGSGEGRGGTCLLWILLALALAYVFFPFPALARAWACLLRILARACSFVARGPGSAIRTELRYLRGAVVIQFPPGIMHNYTTKLEC